MNELIAAGQPLQTILFAYNALFESACQRTFAVLGTLCP